MKLVDILARELKVWPVDLEYAHQDYDGEIRFYGGKEGTTRFDFRVEEKAHDRCADRESRTGSRITRAEWKAAVDALNAPKAVEWPSLGETVEVIKGEAAWSDDQRPMIGVEGKVCSVFKNDCDQKIVAIELSSGECKCFIVECIKPARTAEQIAAEERSKVIREMVEELVEEPRARHFAFCEALYDAGYRKEPKSCGS